jgi:hypothetical protein
MSLIEQLKPLVMDMFPTGSRVICDPPVLDTDEDWVLMVPHRKAFRPFLRELGFTQTSRTYYRVTSSITTYRHPDNSLNLIVTDEQDMFDRWREATEIATQENLTNKEDRIKLFELITGRNKHSKYRYISTRPEPIVTGWFNRHFVPSYNHLLDTNVYTRR